MFRSTGKRTFEEAVKHCRSLLLAGNLYNGTTLSFGSYTRNFFIYDICPHISYRLNRGFSYGKPWAQRQRRLLEKYVQPAFFTHDIRSITFQEIDKFIAALKLQNMSNKTLNHVICTLKSIFGYAELQKIVPENPCKGLKPFKNTIPEKGILTEEEIRNLFDEKQRDQIWPLDMHYVINCLAERTGMRLGELLALRPEDITPESIIVAHSYNTLDKLKGTKTGKTRIVPINGILLQQLRNLCDGKPQDAFVFSHDGKSPIDHKTVYKQYWRALEKIGINKAERNRRNITFHSYRHGVCTRLLESGMPPETVRLILGHSPAMTARYEHIQLGNILSTKKPETVQPSYITEMIDRGILYPDGRRVVANIKNVASYLWHNGIQVTEKFLNEMFLKPDGSKYSMSACKSALNLTNA
jgi:integrase